MFSKCNSVALHLSARTEADLLRSHQLRVTALRLELLRVHRGSDRALARQELEGLLKVHADPVTIFRALNAFEEAGLVLRVLDARGVQVALLLAVKHVVMSAMPTHMYILPSQRQTHRQIKREDAPRMTKSMHVALADLKLHKLYVIYPGERRYPLAPKAECVPFSGLWSLA